MSVVGWARLAAVMVPLVAMQAGAQPPKSVAFTNVSVVPMTGNQVVPNQTVVITGIDPPPLGRRRRRRCRKVRRESRGRAATSCRPRRDARAHPRGNAPRELVDNVLFLYVATGVTTVRGMQGALRARSTFVKPKRGEIVAPNLYLAGPQFGGGSVKSPEDAVARVRQQKSAGTC